MWALFSPGGHPPASLPGSCGGRGPGPGGACRGLHAPGGLSPVPPGLWPYPPSASTSNSQPPASQAAPVLPKALPPPCHPLGSGTLVPFPFPVTSSTPPHPLPWPSVLLPLPSQTSLGLQQNGSGSPASAWHPNPGALWAMASLCSHLAPGARESKDSVLMRWSCRSRRNGQVLGPVSWLKAPAASRLSPLSRPLGAPSSEQR